MPGASCLEPGAGQGALRASHLPELCRRRAQDQLPWEPYLTDEEVQRAEGYYGTGQRLRRVAAKLLAGKPIQVLLPPRPLLPPPASSIVHQARTLQHTALLAHLLAAWGSACVGVHAGRQRDARPGRLRPRPQLRLPLLSAPQRLLPAQVRALSGPSPCRQAPSTRTRNSSCGCNAARCAPP